MSEVRLLSPVRACRRARALRAVVTGPLVAVLVVLAVMGNPSVARAHSELVAATPTVDGVVSELPTQVTLTFSDGVQPSFAQIAVLAPDGSDVTTDDPATAGDVVEQPVALVDPGAYTVSYRIVSADGHTVQGTYGFTVTTPVTTPAPTPGPTSAPAAPAGEPSGTTAAGSSSAVTSTADSVGGRWPTGQVLGGLGVAAVVVGAGVVWRRLHRER